MGQETEVADAHEAWGKDVEQKAPQELLDRQGQEAFPVAVSGVSPAKGDLVAGQRQQAMVGDSDPMGVGAQVVEHIVRPPERRLAVDDPVLAEQGTQEGGEGLGRGQPLQRTVETDLALSEGLFQSGDELAPEDPGQDGVGQEEAVRGAEPTGVVERESAGRHDAMDMGMVLQLLIPGMEHTEEADMGAQIFRITSDFQQGFGTGTEQQTVEEPGVLPGQGRPLMREGEDQVPVASGQDFAAARLDPAAAG